MGHERSRFLSENSGNPVLRTKLLEEKGIASEKKEKKKKKSMKKQ